MTPATRTLIYERDNHCCRRCGVYAYGGSIHHRKARGMGGSKDPRIDQPANLVLLCGSGVTGCHGWIESHRAEAKADGWLLDSVTRAPLTPVRIAGAWVEFWNDGTAHERAA